MAELRINTTGKLSLFDADDSHAASIISGTVTANENVMTLATAGVTFNVPTITLGDATAEDTKIVFDGNAQDFYIALDDSADDLLIGLGSTVGTTPIIGLDENKAVTTYGDFTLTGASTGAVWDSSNNSLDFADSTQLRFGAGADLKLYHDASNSYIVDSGTGALKILGSTVQIMNAAGDENILLGTADGAVTIYNNNIALYNTSATENVFNEASNDIDFRVESDDNQYGFFLEGSTGNVSIGTSSIDVSTQAGGSGYQVLQIENDEGGQINLDHNDAGTGSTLGQINFQRAGEVLAEIEGVTDGATDNGKINFRTQPDGGALAVRWTIDHNGIIYPGAASQGIALGVTAATSSNILDDYEEGEWTYTITGATSGNLGARSGYTKGSYTKIGNLCHVTLRWETDTDNSISGSLKWSLPFTTAAPTDNADAWIAPGFIRDNSFNTNARTGVYYCSEGTAYVYYYFSREVDYNSTIEVADEGDTDGTGEGVITFSYRTA